MQRIKNRTYEAIINYYFIIKMEKAEAKDLIKSINGLEKTLDYISKNQVTITRRLETLNDVLLKLCDKLGNQIQSERHG